MPEIKLRCSSCSKRHLADAELYGSTLQCIECAAPLDSLSFTSPERTRRIPAAVERKEKTLVLDGLLSPLERVAPGRFSAGSASPLASPTETPEHDVTLTQAYWIASAPITQLEFRHLMRHNPAGFPGLNRPVENVTWFEAEEFCARLTQRLRNMRFLDDSLRVRLPSEAEWEYACCTRPTAEAAGSPAQTAGQKGRAKPSSGYGWGDDPSRLQEFAWFAENSGDQTQVVRQKQPSDRRLYDMHGNVSEWCQDWYAAYSPELQVNPVGPASGTLKVRRGGSWASIARRCRGTDRAGIAPHCRSALLGFRVVLAQT